MSERTLKEKPVAKRRTRESADQKAANLQERGEAIKSKLEEVEELIDEALEGNGADDLSDLDRLMNAVFGLGEEEVETYDGERCPCGKPLPDCLWYNADTGELDREFS